MKNEKGFTLIEVLVAMVIVAIAMAGILPLVISSYRIDTQTSYRVRAQYAVTQRLDNLIAISPPVCDGITNTDYIDAQTGQVYATLAAVPGVVRITRTWTVAVAVAPSNLCAITVTATYTDQGGTKTYTAQSQKGL